MGLDARTKAPAKRSAKWSLLFAFGIVFIVVIAVSTARETYREWKVDQEIQSLQTQVQGLEGKRLQLNQLLSRMQSDEVLDEEARARFGMKKPGEKVYVIRGDLAAGESEPTAPVMHADPERIRSNPQRWFDYFFMHAAENTTYGTPSHE
jgi:cell division protein FtsB